METYTSLRAFADSWALAFLFLFFVAVIFWVFRPGSKKVHEDAANIIFRNEQKPKDD
ncbi:cbb3-type cytochrome c oxidase subunit 3 [Amaricoccus macauensis]|uniref:cbb3-type cytochrome c oxidase subunit 3 n=1 Tax=Amaricoccus macauensis TaxID=57001 RepID=UPI003C7E84E7